MNENLELSPDQALAAAKGVITGLTPLIVWLAKTIAPKTPKGLLPALTPLIGMGFGFLLNQVGFSSLNYTDAAIFGALGVTVREIWDQNFQTKERDNAQERDTDPPQKKI